jgi:hypothetical protein
MRDLRHNIFFSKEQAMRTTLDIADDVLFAAKDFARRDKKTLGQVISEWSRAALQNPVTAAKPSSKKSKSKPVLSAEDQKFYDLGFRTFPSRAGAEPVTNEMVNRIREEEGI